MITTIPAPPSAAVIRRALGEFKLPAYEDQVLQIQQYIKILLAWNEKVNLTAIRDPLEILYRHFCESMYAAMAVPVENGRLADVGSGGGFPGLPLKITRPGLRVFLVESNLKKATFLAEVIRDLGLTDARDRSAGFCVLASPRGIWCVLGVGPLGTDSSETSYSLDRRSGP